MILYGISAAYAYGQEARRHGIHGAAMSGAAYANLRRTLAAQVERVAALADALALLSALVDVKLGNLDPDVRKAQEQARAALRLAGWK
jgi:sigma54-dependent transcription regulator